MKRKRILKIVGFVLIIVVIISCTRFPSKVSYASGIPSILIIEALPNSSTGVGTGDAFEYLEVYNNSMASIDLSDYKLESHWDPPNYTTWDLTTSFIIEPEESAIIWVRPGQNNNDNSTLTRNDFRNFYNLTSSELPDSKIYLLAPTGYGLGNTDLKTIKLKTDRGTEISQITYNTTDTGSVVDTRQDKSIVYSYPKDGSTNMYKEASNQEPTPGIILDNQIPNGKEILITEMMVNGTSGIGYGDAFEYIEIYNKGRSPIDLKNYKITYHWSTEGYEDWGIDEHLWVPASGTAVIWIRTNGAGDNTVLTKDDFRQHYSVSSNILPDDSIYILNLSPDCLVPYGMGDTGSPRWVIIKRDYSDQEIAKGIYNVEGEGYDGGSQLQGRSIIFKYPFGDDAIVMRKVANDQTPSPGTINTSVQVPSNTQEGYFIYYGNQHSHTAYSDGATNSTPQTAMEYARDMGKADFFATTDHSEYFSELAFDGNEKWTEMHKMADAVNKDDTFTSYVGYEMTWLAGQGRVGHMNTFLTDWYADASENKPGTSGLWTLQDYYNELKLNDNQYSLSQFNHPSDRWGNFMEFELHDVVIDQRIQALEIFKQSNANGYNLEHRNYYSLALDKGWHVGAVGNQDNHSADWITKDESRTGIVAARQTRQDIFEAIRNRRTYSTTDKNIQVTYTVNGELLGSILDNPSTLNIVVDAYDPDPSDTISSIKIYADANVEVASWSGTASNKVLWNTTLDAKYSYYFVEITQSDGNKVVTAPVWTGGTEVGNSYEITKVEYTSGSTKSIGATISNPTGTALSNIVVEFFKDGISTENKIGQVTLASVPAYGTAKAVLNNWASPASGGYTLYAQANIPIGSVTRSFICYTPVPELLITEIVASNGAAVNVKEPYEFIEIYNNSNSTIDLQDYKISVVTFPDWDIDSSKTLAPGECMVLWLENVSNYSLTLADFNNKYGTNLTSDQVFKLSLSGSIGFNNNIYARTILLKKDNGTDINRTLLNSNDDMGTQNDTIADKSVIYEYPKNRTIHSLKLNSNQTPTPGSTVSGQVAGTTLP